MQSTQFSYWKCLFVFLFFSFFCSALFGQLDTGYVELNRTPENVVQLMALDSPTIGQIQTINYLSYVYIFKNADTTLLLAKKGVELSEKYYPTKVIYPNTLLQLGDAYRVNDAYAEADSLYLKAKTFYVPLKMDNKIAKTDTKLGVSSADQGNYEMAIEYHLNALEIWETAKDTNNLFRPLINISQVFYLIGRKDKALAYNSRALEIGELKNLTGVKAITLGNQGIIEREIGEQYLMIADTISVNSQLYRDSAVLFFEKAKGHYEASLALAKQQNNKRFQIESLNSLSELHLVLKDFDKAIEIGKLAELLAKELNSNNKLLQNKITLSQAYLGADLPKLAVFHGEQALDLAKESKLSLEKSQINEGLYAAYKKLGQFKKALSNYEIFNEHQQKNNEEEQKKTVTELEAKYQNVQKESQILEQKNHLLELTAMNAKIEKQRNYLIGGSLFLGIFGFLGFYFNKIRNERNDKIAFAEALIFAQEEERKRIARDLHDGVGQSLLLIKKQLFVTHEVTQENQLLISDTLEEVRSISQDLHPFQLEKFGLTAAINEMLHKVENSTDLFISKEIDPIDKLLDEKAEINLFRTIQETLNNIVKHSAATAAKITIEKADKKLIINIQDNGKGFDHELAIVTSKSLGLRTMFERIAALGGKLKIEKGQPKGTRIRIQIPVS